MKKVKILGKSVPILVLVLLGIGLVSGALLTYYGSIKHTINVTQAVVVEGEGAKSFTNVAGDTIVDCGYSVKNNAGVVAPIKFGTTCRNTAGFDDGTRNESSIDWSTFSNNRCDGIETEIYGILELTKKDITTWQPIAPEEAITIRYTIVGNEFNYAVMEGEIPEGYELVYAMDKENRFNDYATVKKVSEITESLPMDGDWNAGESANYCDMNNTFDDYEHCVGAKLWIVKSDNIKEGGVLTWANMADYYYETDLIMYSNDANNVMNLLANGGGFNFCVEQNFALELAKDTYTLETQIQPATS